MRRYITLREFNQLLTVARDRPRDALLLLLGFRHGLRISEALRLRWRDLDLEERSIVIQRSKRGVNGTHPVAADECLRIQNWRAETRYARWDDFVFAGTSGKALSRQYVHRLFRRYGETAGLPIRFHPHCLRHGCGFALANAGHDTRLIQDYLGHRAISSTMVYTTTNRNRFSTLWGRSQSLTEDHLHLNEDVDDQWKAQQLHRSAA